MRVFKKGDGVKRGVSARMISVNSFSAARCFLTLGATGEVFLHLHARVQVQLAIAVGAQNLRGFVVVHKAVSLSFPATSSSRSRPLARASRDITVPIGIPAITAISL